MIPPTVAPPTSVHFTVDVECRAEHRRGAQVEPALGYDERVWGRLANQGEELGLRRLLAELEARGFRGTFFVDPTGAHDFGREGLREVCTEILSRGHDVQLHLHPSLRRARWLSRGEPPLSDDMADYEAAEQARLLREGIALLEGAGVPRARVVASRAGNFAADNRTWQAMAEVGLSLGSSYNPCYASRGCRIEAAAAAPGLFASGVPGVAELPITCFAQRQGAGAPSYRHLQIGAVSAAETIECLEQSRRLGIAHVTILMHPFELFFLDAHHPPRGRVNGINLRRLRTVLDHLAQRREAFAVRAVADVARDAVPAGAVQGYPVGRASLRLGRSAGQAVKRLARRLAVRRPWKKRFAPGQAQDPSWS